MNLARQAHHLRKARIRVNNYNAYSDLTTPTRHTTPYARPRALHPNLARNLEKPSMIHGILHRNLTMDASTCAPVPSYP